ncbi:hypothetical protein Val02_75380 [Virgisporangium aliadipatigenens]|uniref:L-type lectin-like domain-containing protein n=1 Tax=Virgisporangium aliadipatigenens TaxID=741659 RepID=A0A8J4DW01_9ACTN|nr:hypothetical protein [Virgisporangium aliadipatigenens]GIJ50652.1 hypothetical protein Val02_75380 [Virgisporangium aliadipatigenens]
MTQHGGYGPDEAGNPGGPQGHPGQSPWGSHPAGPPQAGINGAPPLPVPPVQGQPGPGVPPLPPPPVTAPGQAPWAPAPAPGPVSTPPNVYRPADPHPQQGAYPVPPQQQSGAYAVPVQQAGGYPAPVQPMPPQPPVYHSQPGSGQVPPPWGAPVSPMSSPPASGPPAQRAPVSGAGSWDTPASPASAPPGMGPGNWDTPVSSAATGSSWTGYSDERSSEPEGGWERRIEPSPEEPSRRGPLLIGALAGFLVGAIIFGTVGYLAGTERGDEGTPAAAAGPSSSSAPATKSANVSAPPTGWKQSGDAKIEGGKLVLTPAEKEKTGAVIYQTPIVTAGLRAKFTIRCADGDGGDGVAFLLLDAGKTKPDNALGQGGGGLGFSGQAGVAVAFVTYPQADGPKSAFVGISTAGNGRNLTYLVTSTSIPDLRSGEHEVEVVIANGVITVTIDKTKALEGAAAVPANAYVGFSGATGGRTDLHEVSKVDFSY